MSNIKDFIHKVPKAEIHVHLEGTLEADLLFKLAKRNKIELEYNSVEELKKAYNYSCLQDFLDLYYKGSSVLINEEDFYDLTYSYLKNIHGQNVRHVELMFDPQSHTHRGVALDTVFKGITQARIDAQRDFGISSAVILSFLRHLSEDDAIATFKSALVYRDNFFAIGLDSSEIGHPPDTFERLYKLAHDEGLICVAHAGEEGPAQNVRAAIELLKVVRVDHGYSALDDPELIKTIVEKQIPMTFCPLSNLALKVVKSLEEHPLKKALNLGVLVSVNSDDPGYFHGNLIDNYVQSAEALNLSISDIKQLVINSFKSSFLSNDEKLRFIGEIEMLAKKLATKQEDSPGD